MSNHRPRILLGPFADDPSESVSLVNRAFVGGLADRYQFLCQNSNRAYGAPRQALFNGVNLFYLAKHLSSWAWHLARGRPLLAHYAITSGWAMEKSLFFLRLARLAGVKTLGHLHGGGFLDAWRQLPKLRRRLALRELVQLDGLVVLSAGWKKSVAEQIGLPSERLFVVNNPTSEDFETAALQMPIERETSERVLSIGVMEQKKGVLDLIEATHLMATHAPFTVQLVGPEREPNILEKVRRLIIQHALSNQVEILAGVWGPAKLELFRSCRMLVLPSYFENFPLVVLEAAAAGVPIVTTPVGAVPEFFEHGVSALFVEPGNPGQLARAMTTLLDDPSERVRLASAAREVFCRRLARSNIMNSLDRVYQCILKRGHNLEDMTDGHGAEKETSARISLA